MTDERKDRENKPATESDEHVPDLKSKKLERDEEGKVKGGVSDNAHGKEIEILS